MNTIKTKLLLVFCMVSLTTPTFGATKGPLVWDMDALAQIRNEGMSNDEYRKIISDANRYSKILGPTVMDKAKYESGDKHNFESVAPYYWPDPNNPDGKYICKDGQMNPEYNLYDRMRIDNLADRCKNLATAFYLTGDTVYSSAWLRDMRRWFIDKATRMYPQFDYAQIIPTITTKGVPGGIIEAYVLTDVVDGILLMDSMNALKKNEGKELKKWFKSLVHWLTESNNGIRESNVADNHSTAYDVLLYSLSMYTNNKKYCTGIERNFASKRLYKQIAQNGAQTEELKRTLSIKYSIYNLTHIVDFCTMARKRGVDIYGENKTLIYNACHFVKDIVERRDNSQYQESGDWRVYEHDLNREMKRLGKLGTKR